MPCYPFPLRCVFVFLCFSFFSFHERQALPLLGRVVVSTMGIVQPLLSYLVLSCPVLSCREHVGCVGCACHGRLYSRVPPNGLVIYCGTIVTDEGKEKRMNLDFEPFKAINTSLYLCDNKFHTEVQCAAGGLACRKLGRLGPQGCHLEHVTWKKESAFVAGAHCLSRPSRCSTRWYQKYCPKRRAFPSVRHGVREAQNAPRSSTRRSVMSRHALA